MASVEQVIKQATKILQDAGYTHGDRESQIFLAEILKIDTNALFSRYEEQVDAGTEEMLQEAVEKRLEGQPVGYVVGNQSFMGWTFISDERALIPRPETEQLVEELVRDIRSAKLQDGNFLEIGTGAGPIAIALKKYFPNSTVTATDISEEALSLAEENAKRLKVDVNFLQSNLFENVDPKKKYDVIVANLPYVPTQKLQFVSDQILDWEPMIAIEAGEDGMLYITPFLEQVGKFLKKDGLVAIEFWHTHGDAVKDLAEKYLPNYEVDVRKDLAGFDRYAFFLPN